MENDVVIHVDNIHTRIRGELPPEAISALDDEMSFTVQGCRFSPKYQKGAWDGRKRFFSRKTLRFPTGLVRRCRNVLEEFDVPYTHQDERSRPDLHTTHPLPFKGITLFKEQEEAVEAALQVTRGVIKAPCGFGKTEVIMKLVSSLNVPTNIFTHRAPLFYQLVERLKSRCGVDAGIIGDGKFAPRQINVAMIQTAYKNPKALAILRKAALNVYDECQIIPTDSLYKTHTKLPHSEYLFGLSATPWRDDGNDLYIEAAVGPIIYSTTVEAMVKRKRLVPADIVFVHRKPDSDRKARETYQELYERVVVFNPARATLVASVVKWLISRNKTVLITVQRIDHGNVLMEALETFCPEAKTRFVRGELESKEKYGTLQELDKRELDVVVATTVYDLGVDIPSLDCLINARSGASSVGTYQLVGRVLRVSPGKERALVVDIVDNCEWLGEHANAREKILKTEKAFNIKHVHELNKVIDTLKETFGGE